MRKIILLLLLATTLCSCYYRRESPVIYLSNASTDPISNVRLNWVKKHTMSLPLLLPGNTRSQSFYISSSSDFLGNVLLSWHNKDGRKISKEFSFKKSNLLPNVWDRETYSYVQIYINQNGFEIVTSDSVDPSIITRNPVDPASRLKFMDEMLYNYHQQYLQKMRSQKDQGQDQLIKIDSVNNPIFPTTNLLVQ